MSPTRHRVAALHGKISIHEVLDTVIALDTAAHDFYLKLAPKISKRIRYLVEELAAEEEQHIRKFKELATRPDLVEVIKTEIECNCDDSQFSDALHMPDLGEHPDDQDVLHFALGREQMAMEHYTELALKTPPGPIRDLFVYLRDEETRHKIELEKKYYELVHRGGGV